MNDIKVENLTVSYSGKAAVKGVTFSVKPNEFLCLLGPSGCGKTTILNSIAGFIRPASGRVMVNKWLVEGLSQEVGIVFQEHNLFPWKTVAENVGFGPKMNKVERTEMESIVEEFLQLVSLKGFGNSYPKELSGGMQQRVGIARALANNPKALLLDEPFGSLDAQTRIQMQELLLSVWEKKQKTVVFVTHDIDEAILLADRIIVLTKSPGQVKQEIKIGLPRPRSYNITLTKGFTEIKRKILELLK
ncbi:MAG: ABC transporter ATP-binding protein [Candidatus Diapherotrites archaeon]|uniref:Molybdate/tungstate import ATP-binding protein WtpC n=1 Tax=Candidatus Iainarchaeum sp. TaxID=3101447 RepID=A0A938YUA4_9ARCH|nr:ABC transporter ATP-binding protein [Candidatus Diapherotrites archaeon]